MTSEFVYIKTHSVHFYWQRDQAAAYPRYAKSLRWDQRWPLWAQSLKTSSEWLSQWLHQIL